MDRIPVNWALFNALIDNDKLRSENATLKNALERIQDMFNESSENEEIRLRAENAKLKECLFQMQNAAIDINEQLKTSEADKASLRAEIQQIETVLEANNAKLREALQSAINLAKVYKNNYGDSSIAENKMILKFMKDASDALTPSPQSENVSKNSEKIDR